MANLNIAPMLHIQSTFSTQVSSLELSSSAEVFSLKALVAVVFPPLANKASNASEMEAFHFSGFKIYLKKNPVRNNSSSCMMPQEVFSRL